MNYETSELNRLSTNRRHLTFNLTARSRKRKSRRVRSWSTVEVEF